MTTNLPEWAQVGATVFELHCSTSDYSTKKTIPATIAAVSDRWITLDTGHRYRTSEGSGVEPIRYQRDDPRSKSRYFLLVGPNDPKVTS